MFVCVCGGGGGGGGHVPTFLKSAHMKKPAVLFSVGTPISASSLLM